MSRWKPDARGRLEQAAFDLFRERGYEATTVDDIAAHAGLTERTFFRHYADKREVFFGGSALLQEKLARTLDALPSGLPALEVVRVAIEDVSTLFHGRRTLASERRRIVAAHLELQERELIKRATLTQVVASALKRRDVSESIANLAADIGMAVFYTSFDRWLDEPADREFAELVRDGFEQLQAIASAASPGRFH